MTNKGGTKVRDDSISIAKQQVLGHGNAVGQTVSLDLINSIKEAVKGAKPHPLYKTHAGVPFVYETLKFEGWDDIVRPLALAWIEVGWLSKCNIDTDCIAESC